MPNLPKLIMKHAAAAVANKLSDDDMAGTPFRSLSLDDRRYALNFAADRSGRRAYLLE